MDDTGPVEIEATGVQNKGGLYGAFWDYKFTNTYASGLKLIGSTAEPRGVKFESDEGWIFIHAAAAKSADAGIRMRQKRAASTPSQT